MPAELHENLADFDFIIGSWKVAHRRLKERLANCTDWEEFHGTSVTRKILGGFGNLEDNVIELPNDKYCAVALRSFNAATAQWAIWWLDARWPWTLDVPVIGSFVNGRGEFYASDTFKGIPIRMRFLWTVPAPDKPRWEQAFSSDDGATWETNWVMDFERA